jgi:hypothetical protein
MMLLRPTITPPADGCASYYARMGAPDAKEQIGTGRGWVVFAIVAYTLTVVLTVYATIWPAWWWPNG